VDSISLLGAGTYGTNWTVSNTDYVSSDQGGGVTRLTFNSTDAAGTITMNDGSSVAFHDVDYIDYT
ncbi:MAG: hypothetical protein ACD_29C00063G0001, partial [uncultured bacterium]